MSVLTVLTYTYPLYSASLLVVFFILLIKRFSGPSDRVTFLHLTPFPASSIQI